MMAHTTFWKFELFGRVLVCLFRTLANRCTPAVRVPAGDRRSYNTTSVNGRNDEQRHDTGHVGSTAGAGGFPLTIAMVALRDLPAGTPLSCAWVDAEDSFPARTARLEEYARVSVLPPPRPLGAVAAVPSPLIAASLSGSGEFASAPLEGQGARCSCGGSGCEGLRVRFRKSAMKIADFWRCGSSRTRTMEEYL